MGSYSRFLFAEPSFREGMARVLDLGGTLNEYNYSRSGRLADYFALRSDWLAVGHDIWQAIGTVQEKVPVPPTHQRG